MRVLLVVSSSGLAGTERPVVDLAAGLRAAGVEAEVACAPGGGGLDAVLERRSVPVHRMELEGPGLGLPRRLPRLAALAASSICCTPT